jgi:hypothetical protein
MNNPETTTEIKMDVSNLYREEVFTDNAVGTLRRMTPVTTAGEPDPTRSEQYIGSTQVLTTARNHWPRRPPHLATAPGKLSSAPWKSSKKCSASRPLRSLYPARAPVRWVVVAWVAAASRCPERNCLTVIKYRPDPLSAARFITLALCLAHPDALKETV